MNIDSLGEGKIDLLYSQGLVYTPADLYSLTYDRLFGLEKVIEDENGKVRTISFKEKTVQNILNALQQSKTVPFERVLLPSASVWWAKLPPRSWPNISET